MCHPVHICQESTPQIGHFYLAVVEQGSPIPRKIVIGIESHEDIGLCDSGTLLEPRLRCQSGKEYHNEHECYFTLGTCGPHLKPDIPSASNGFSPGCSTVFLSVFLSFVNVASSLRSMPTSSKPKSMPAESPSQLT